MDAADADSAAAAERLYGDLDRLPAPLALTVYFRDGWFGHAAEIAAKSEAQ
jgi:hypothetical protein